MTIPEVVDFKRSLGYGGAVLTNHCQRWYYEKKDHKDFVERFIRAYSDGRKYADEVGFSLLLGIEITVEDPAYSDWLVYGVTEKFLRSSPCFYDLSQRELYEYCHSFGAVMVQAHPFRAPICPMPAEFSDGVEINCQPRDLVFRGDVTKYASEHSLLVTAGTDFHFTDMTYVGGMIVPDGLSSAEEFASLLKGGEYELYLGGERVKFKRKP